MMLEVLEEIEISVNHAYFEYVQKCRYFNRKAHVRVTNSSQATVTGNSRLKSLRPYRIRDVNLS